MLERTLFVIFIVYVEFTKTEIHTGGILFPKETETRQIISLDGLWNFVVSNAGKPLDGFEQHWFKKNLRDVVPETDISLMPVPASYNDITTDWRVRDHVGLVWYDRTFFVPKYWSESGRVWLRFGSVCYAAQVTVRSRQIFEFLPNKQTFSSDANITLTFPEWVNGQLAMSHEIGHLPFVAEVTAYLKFGKENRVTVAVDNTLLSDTIPQGRVQELSSGRRSQLYSFDFFNYAGIDRPVKLYTTPKTYIDDVSVITSEVVENAYALMTYQVTVFGDPETLSCRVTLVDKHKNIIAAKGENQNFTGLLKVENPKLWWPYLMHSTAGYMYSLEVELLDSSGDLMDKYILPVGIRQLSWTSEQLLINNKPVYLHGFGRHEDSDIRGKGLDLPLIIRDHNLIKWIGANAYRTSHYPYAEEIMDLADEMGIMIIDECSSVNTEIFGDTLLLKHKVSLTELIKRDKNRPAVIMWSASNEPRTQQPASKEYFRQIIDLIKSLDVTRPTTIVEAQSAVVTYASEFVDIISFNRYNGWYHDGGNLDVVTQNVINEAKLWRQKFGKPVIMQEYGGDTLEGLHFVPDFIWSEEYQDGLLSRHFEAFDQLRKEGYFIGEFIWNFADFKTAQTYTRVGGNKKGIFTRSRQPKSSAHHLRKRYWSLAQEYANATLPEDLKNYVIEKNIHVKDEL